MYPAEKDTHLLPVTTAPARASRPMVRSWTNVLALLVLAGFGMHQLHRATSSSRVLSPDSFFWTSNNASTLCPGLHGSASYSGYIGLSGDGQDAPRRSFYWFFEAQNDAENAPVILTVGGGPGTSGLLNPLFGQSHCTVVENGTVPNSNAWTEKYNVLALDHPIGAGYSYGVGVDNSRDAAIDVYDFLQKFFTLYPRYATNPFVVASGSYGGVYVPHIATVIHDNNNRIAAGLGPENARIINLESLMLSNPLSDARSWFTWHLQQTCYNTEVYNATQCAEYYSQLPACLEKIELAYALPTVDNRVEAYIFCVTNLMLGDLHGHSRDNVDHKCTSEDPVTCTPEVVWAADFLNSTNTKKILGVPEELSFQSMNVDVTEAFVYNGDHVQQAYLLYEPLLKAGIRVLHYIGKRDTIVGWPSTLSFLRLLGTPFSEEFRSAADVPWPTEDIATVRAIGPGAGNFTLVYMTHAGHFVTQDEPQLAKSIVDRWVSNMPWFSS